MMIISSQQYINDQIVAEKIEALKASGVSFVEIPCEEVGELNGEECLIQVDGHHTLAAAHELDLEVRFVDNGKVEDYDSYTTTDERLEAHYADGEYYNVETSNPYLYDFDLIF
nr:MAG TPA: Putative ParB-like nuclease [Caudoviricetes sp.]